MQILVSGKKLKVGQSLTQYVNEKVDYLIDKYFEKIVNINVVFSKQGHMFTCDILFNEGSKKKIVIKSKAHSDEVYNAFDMALVRIEKQLRKYKSKLQDKASKININIAAEEAMKYILSPEEIKEDKAINPPIIAEKPVEILTLSVSDAVMKMDLENLPALMFRNVRNDRINVVYYRKDGNISWVDTK